MSSKTDKDASFDSDLAKAEGTGGQQGSVLKGERAPQRDKAKCTEEELRTIGEKVRRKD